MGRQPQRTVGGPVRAVRCRPSPGQFPRECQDLPDAPTKTSCTSGLRVNQRSCGENSKSTPGRRCSVPLGARPWPTTHPGPHRRIFDRRRCPSRGDQRPGRRPALAGHAFRIPRCLPSPGRGGRRLRHRSACVEASRRRGATILASTPVAQIIPRDNGVLLKSG